MVKYARLLNGLAHPIGGLMPTRTLSAKQTFRADFKGAFGATSAELPIRKASLAPKTRFRSDR
jgi:hypothetical protein